MSPLFEKNILALQRFSPQAATQIRDTPGSSFSLGLSRSGHPVPLVSFAGSDHPVHSLYDPLKEAQKVMSQYRAPCVLFLGFGGGFWVSEALKSPDRELVAVLDLLPGMTRKVLENEDWSEVFQNPRFRLLSTPGDLKSCYRPGIMGSLEAVALPPLERLFPPMVEKARQLTEQALSDITADQATQGKLGRQWMRNTWRNLDFIREVRPNLPSGRRIWVTGAGPSLEVQMRSFQKGDLLFTSDTALPCLQALGLEPDLVMTLDPQYYSLLHYLPGSPRGIILRELGTFPGLQDFSPNTMFFLSRNPLHLWLYQQGLHLPLLETRSGNVIGTLLQLAWSFHPQKVLLAGTDMAFPRGQTYARETYQHHFHSYRSTKVKTLESALADQLFQGSTVLLEKNFRINQNQKLYRDRLEKWPLPGKIFQVPGMSPPLALSEDEKIRPPMDLENFPSRVSFLKDSYYTELKRLPQASSWLEWSGMIPPEQQLLFETLGPWLSWIHFHRNENLKKNWPIILEELSDIIFTEGSNHGIKQ